MDDKVLEIQTVTWCFIPPLSVFGDIIEDSSSMLNNHRLIVKADTQKP